MAAAREAKPCFHVAPPQGWVNDPNGPIFYKGYYHMFYQYVETGCQWSWGLLWGHAVSRDLITWQHLPPALTPTFGGFDGDGCFSGCATLDEDGTPTILYTGVRLRSSESCGPLPPPECDLGNACIETQCMAFGDPADPKLTYWTKDEVPFLSLPPPNMNLTAWRDPYVIGRPGQDGQDCWTVMVGAGVKECGGTALVYKSKALRGGTWSYAGELCRGAGDTGVIWECPVMLQLPCLPAPPPPVVAAPPGVKAQSPLPIPLAEVVFGPTPPDGKAHSRGKQRSPVSPPAEARHLADLSNVIIPSPASPRPPLKSPVAAVAAGGGITFGVELGVGVSAVDEAGGVATLSAPMAAVALSPRRPVVMAPPQPPMSPLRSPARWNLPALHALPHAPSPPAPRPPSSRRTSTSSTGHFSPMSILPETMRRTPPPSPRLAVLTPSDAASHPLMTHGSPTSPLPPRSPAGAVAALLSGTAIASPRAHGPLFSPRAKPQQTATATLSPPRPPSVAIPDGGAAAPAVPIDWRRHQTFFCVCPDDCNSMSMYYLGSFDPRVAAFDLKSALGPFPLDLGDIFYAPNTLTDPEGRTVLWGWLQEKPRKVGTYDYAGCLSMPRMLFLEVHEQSAAAGGGASKPAVHLVQRPPPDIAKLRIPGSEWLGEGLLLDPGSTLPVPLASGHHIELELSMAPLPQPLMPLSEASDTPGRTPGPAGTTPASTPNPIAASSTTAAGLAAGVGGSRCSGVLLHSWRSGAEGSAALLYHWDSGVLEVIFEAMDPATLTFSLAAPGVRRVGGRLMRPPAPGSPLALRVFLDHSCLEVFTGSGEVLTARVYRGSGGHHHHKHLYAYSPSGVTPTHGSGYTSPTPSMYEAGGAAAAGVELVSFGCSTEFASVGAYEVGSIWVEDV